MAEKEKVLFTQWIILLLIAPARMVHNDVNDRSILLHCLSPFINVILGKVLGKGKFINHDLTSSYLNIGPYQEVVVDQK